MANTPIAYRSSKQWLHVNARIIEKIDKIYTYDYATNCYVINTQALCR